MLKNGAAESGMLKFLQKINGMLKVYKRHVENDDAESGMFTKNPAC